MRLKDKVAIVTGGASGIGLQSAETFAREGARVAVVDMNAEGAASVADKLPGNGHIALGCDVTDSARVDAVVGEVVDSCGRVDILMNNAGVARTPGDGFEEAIAAREFGVLHMSDDAFNKMMEIHVSGSFYFIRACARPMRDHGGGSIILISSIAGLAGHGPIHYAAAKAAILGITKSMARDLGPAKIRINAICPGVIDTPMTQAVEDHILAPMVKATPMRRQGVADDIANLGLFLASEESSFITGQAISPNGGLVIT